MAAGFARPPATAAELAFGLGVAATVGGLAAAKGGYFPEAWGTASLVLLWMLAVGALLPGRIHCRRLEALMLASLSGLVVWSASSILWSLDPEQSVLETGRLLLYLAGVAALLLYAPRGSAAAILAGIAVACAGVASVALVTRAGDHTPLSDPLGYSNALGLLAAMGTILVLGFAGNAATFVARSAAVVALIPLVAALLLSESVGALAALVVGLAVVAALLRRAEAVLAVALGCAALAAAMPANFERESLEPRARYWAVAWQSAAQTPLRGQGAGSFARTWLERRPSGHSSRSAHNLYLETLGELGLAGLGLLLTALAAPLAAVARARASPLGAAAAGAYAAFLVHAAFDWDWDMPVLVVAGLGCGAALLVAARGDGPGRRPPARVRAAALASVVALGLLSYSVLVGSLAMTQSRDAVALGAFQRVRTHAHEASRWAPWATAPWSIVGEAALARGDLPLARASFRQGLERDPHSWRLWAGLARSSRGHDHVAAAAHARRLNPLGSPQIRPTR